MTKTVEVLLREAVAAEYLESGNPHLLPAVVGRRLHRKISEITGIPLRRPPSSSHRGGRTSDFSALHGEILEAYEYSKHRMVPGERTVVERVLSTDAPGRIHLRRFARLWHRIDPLAAAEWFAVDGTLGPRPESYVGRAFSERFRRHNECVRKMLSIGIVPEVIGKVVREARRRFVVVGGGGGGGGGGGETNPDADPSVVRCAGLYSRAVGEEEMKRAAEEEEEKEGRPPVRRRKSAPSAAPPAAPPNSPESRNET